MPCRYSKCQTCARLLVLYHYNDVIMGKIASQITSLTIVYSTVYSDADQGKHQSSASLAFVRGIHRGPVNSPHKGPVTRKMFPFDDVIMQPLLFGFSCSKDMTVSLPELPAIPFLFWLSKFFVSLYWSLFSLISASDRIRYDHKTVLFCAKFLKFCLNTYFFLLLLRITNTRDTLLQFAAIKQPSNEVPVVSGVITPHGL